MTEKKCNFCVLVFENFDFLKRCVEVREIGHFTTDFIWYTNIQIACEVNKITKKSSF